MEAMSTDTAPELRCVKYTWQGRIHTIQTSSEENARAVGDSLRQSGIKRVWYAPIPKH